MTPLRLPLERSGQPLPVREPTAAGSTSHRLVETGGLRVSKVEFSEGKGPLHFHERACLSVMLRGSFTECILGRVIACQESGVLLKPAGEPHQDHFAGSVQIIVEPDEEYASRMSERATLFAEVSYSRSLVASAIAGRIERELEGSDTFTPLAVEGLTLELLACLLRAGRGPASGPAPSWLRRVRERLDESGPLPDVSQLATDVDVHPAYLARAFRRAYGVSIGQYARDVRLRWVLRRLVETDESLSAIAFRAGFADQSHLTRAFRKRFGVTPGLYRLACVAGRA